ncbi:MAG: M1 family metallopeptidase [Gammaproteobacteria bacterium]|nr:MAG: M1 family metallopeptidase [Gammaproteobacteria bacterium]
MPRAWPAGTAAAAAAIAHLALGAPPASAAATPNDIRIDGAAIHVELEPRAFRDGGDAVREWIRRSASIVTGYYGRFPATRLTVRVMAEAGEGVHGGKSFANPDASIRVQVGREVRGAQLLSDWVLVHEMTHLALPDTGEAHAWLSEGIATYVEGVARVQAGNRSEADVWAEEIRQMPRGMPQADDRGLDHTHTWGRTYWGGAMFCLLADVEIRTQTHNRFGLQDALRAVARESGGLSADWPIERVLRTGDGAGGTTTLEDLYAQMKDRPVTPDLMKLWQQLGIEPEGSAVRLSDSAPLAEVRRAIMRAP